MAEFTPIETQEQFDKMIANRLERAENKIRAEYADYNAIKAANEKLTTDFEALKAENDGSKATIADLNTKIAGLETSQLRTRIGLEHNIPFEMISRLAGNTEEEIKADAEAMAKFVARTQTAPLKGNEPNTGDTIDVAYKQLTDSLFKK